MTGRTRPPRVTRHEHRETLLIAITTLAAILTITLTLAGIYLLTSR